MAPLYQLLKCNPSYLVSRNNSLSHRKNLCQIKRDLKNDGDPMSDFFDTMRRSSRIKTSVSTVGHVFLGFKVLDNDRNKVHHHEKSEVIEITTKTLTISRC